MINRKMEMKDLENILNLFPFVGIKNIGITYDIREKLYIISIFDRTLYKNNEEKIETEDILVTRLFLSKDCIIHNIEYSAGLINSKTQDFVYKLGNLLNYKITDLEIKYSSLKK